MDNNKGSTTSKITDFQIINKLGSGSFSEVFKVIRKSDKQTYALKKVKFNKLSQKEKDNSINEVRILASVSHPNIAGYKDAFIEEGTQTLCIVMEYADGGDLQSKIDKLKKNRNYMPEETIWSIFNQMVQGLEALHAYKIVHRDIKCANVFLTKDGTVKLGDLNVSKIAKQGYMHTQTGTPYYASPEVWQDKPYDKSSDIWSLGAVLYELTALNPPFTAKDMNGLYNRVIRGIYPRIPHKYSSDLSAMIASLLKVDPKKRPSAEQILQMPVFIARHNERDPDNPDQQTEYGNEPANLLNTIKVPRNLSLLSERLPKSNYDSEKPKREIHQDNLTDVEEEANNQNKNKQLKQDVSSNSVPRSASVLDKVSASNDKKNPIKPKSKMSKGGGPHSINRSERLINYQEKQSHSDLLISNQGSTSSSKIIQTNDKLKQKAKRGGMKIQMPHSRQPSAQNDLLSNNARRDLEVISEQLEVDYNGNGGGGSVPSSKQMAIRVKPYKKRYLNDIPTSCPSQRSNINDIYNIQNEGQTPPAIQKGDRLKRLNDLQKDKNSDYQQQLLSKNHSQINLSPSTGLQNEPHSQPILPQIHSSKEKRKNHPIIATNHKNNNLIQQIYSSQQSHPVNKLNPIRDETSRGKQKGITEIRSRQNLHDISELIPNNRRVYGRDDITSTQNDNYSQSPYNGGDILRNRYGGAQNVLKAGRIEQQALLNRYQRIDASSRKNGSAIPLSQKGMRNIGSGPDANLINKKQQIPVSYQQSRNAGGIVHVSPQYSQKPVWWG